MRFGFFLMMMRAASFILLLVLLPVTLPLAHAAEREECSLCGMYLDLYAKTRFVIVLNDETTRYACSLACAARIIDENGEGVRDIRVASFMTAELIDARSAVYLEGSDVPGVMSYTSRLAFPTRKDARAFQRKHGGKILSFDDAIRNQLRDRE